MTMPRCSWHARCTLDDPLELRLPADVDTIPPLRRVLGRWLREAEATTVEIEEISLACSEACANAIEHAYAPGRPRSRCAPRSPRATRP